MSKLPEELVKRCEEIADRHENDAHLYGAWNACNGSAEDAAEAALEWAVEHGKWVTGATRDEWEQSMRDFAGSKQPRQEGR